MDRLQQALKEELASRLKSGRVKSTSDLSNVMTTLFREAIQEMLKAEMDGPLGYEKHAPERVEFSNSRNGKTTKKVKSKLGEVAIDVSMKAIPGLPALTDS